MKLVKGQIKVFPSSNFRSNLKIKIVTEVNKSFIIHSLLVMDIS